MFLWHLYATPLHFELACMASMILQGVFLQQQCLNWKRQAGRSVVSSQNENFPMQCPLHENFLATSHMKYCQLPRRILNRRAKWTSVITFFSWKLLHVCMCVTLWINVHIIATDTFTMATCNYKYCKAIPNAMLRHCSCSKSKFAYNFKKFISNLTLLHRALHPPCASVYFRRNFLYYYFQFLLLWQS